MGKIVEEYIVTFFADMLCNFDHNLTLRAIHHYNSILFEHPSTE